MSEERFFLSWFPPADQARWNEIAAAVGEVPEAFEFGVNVAKDHIRPRMLDGRCGMTKAEMDQSIAGYLKAGLKDLRSHYGREPTDDERFLFRIGLEAVAFQAREEALTIIAAGTKLGMAFGLAQAAKAACDEGLALLGEVKPPTFLAPPHLLSMPTPPARRPLRPEDFGCLPRTPQR